eukprot:PLAT13945.1.p1 GENE.PLAT13945.1~~PLAT13945.1.p1  ORF type:complete len:245 (+),score=83.12 PLAT13945.1:67-735(+)
MARRLQAEELMAAEHVVHAHSVAAPAPARDNNGGGPTIAMRGASLPPRSDPYEDYSGVSRLGGFAGRRGSVEALYLADNDIELAGGGIARSAAGLRLQTFQLSRSVRAFAMLDMFLLGFYGLTISSVLVLLFLMPLLGYYGAKTLRRGPLAAYILFVGLTIAGRLLLLINSSGLSFSLLMLLSVFVECWIMRLVTRLYTAIGKLTDGDRAALMELNERVGVC